MTDLERFQMLKEKVDRYNTNVIEKELKVKTLNEEKDKLLEDMKTLGYNSVEDMQQDYLKLSEQVSNSLNEMEAKLNVI